MTKCIALWSGPRNISTAMMRSWDARSDTTVCDEPLYAHYLARTGHDHPAASDIVRTGITDYTAAVDRLVKPTHIDSGIFYQKHMGHHLFTELDTSWISQLTNGLLIRNPKEMLLSLLKVLPNPDLEATGLPQQLNIFMAETERHATRSPIVDAQDVLENPAGMLRSLCTAFDVPYTDEMLHWEAGTRPTDGVWAPHWYASVEASTGFMPYQPKAGALPARFTNLLRECEAIYNMLAEHKLNPSEA